MAVDKDRKREYDRRRYHENRERLLAQAAEYREANRERIRQKARLLWHARRDKRLPQMREYYHEHKQRTLDQVSPPVQAAQVKGIAVNGRTCLHCGRPYIVRHEWQLCCRRPECLKAEDVYLERMRNG